MTGSGAWEVNHCESLKWLLTRDDGSIDMVYVDPPFMTQRDFGSFDDRWDDVRGFVAFLMERMVEARRVLRPTGNLLLHLDWRTAPYLRVEMDRLFGVDMCINEIAWAYNSGGASPRHLSRKHDTILWYAKSCDYTFNIMREPYATPNVQGRDGFHEDGRMLTDVWDVPFLSTTSKERTGYPTQKPVALLRRAVEVFSNPGDTVLDFFCGSGTTGVAAVSLGRRTVLVDQSTEATGIATKRLDDMQPGFL